MIDRFYLEMKQKKKGLSTADMSHVLGLTEKSYRDKLAGKRDFKASEISKLMKTLDLDILEVKNVFLCSQDE